MLDAEVGTKAEAFASTICVVGYKSLLPISLNVLDSREVLDNGLKVLDSLEVLDNLELFNDGLEVYDQFLPNGLADPLGIELLEL